MSMETPPAVAASERLADLALVPPHVEVRPPSRYTAAEMDYGMTIGIERTRGGRLWAAWVGGGDNQYAYMALGTSDDDGLTWTDVRMVIDPHDPSLPQQRRSLVANLWLDPHGRLWFFFDQAMTSFDGRAGLWATRCDAPDDPDPLWTQPQRIWHGCALNKPIVLRDGTWLMAASLWDRAKIPARETSYRDAFHDLDPFRGVNPLASTDGGQTWQRRGTVTFPQPQFDEASIVERKDGSLWMTARTRASVWESFSTDGGRAWSAPRESAIRNTSARHQVRRLPSGRLLLIKHGPRVGVMTVPLTDYSAGRRELTAFLSEDEGLTWQGGLTFDEREPVTYPDVALSPDGAIYVSYDYARETLGHICMARFREADILAQSFVSADALTKQIIFKPHKSRA